MPKPNQAAPLPPPPAPPMNPPTPRQGMQPPAAPPQPSSMARTPVAKTSRVVPSVKTTSGKVVRTDTHNQANQVPHHAKHRGRGKP